MGRLTGAILSSNDSYAQGRTAPVLDLTLGGQFGYVNNLNEWVSNQAYVRRNLIPVLIEAPRFFSYLEGGSTGQTNKWTNSLKALVELHCRKIEGLQAGLEVETEEHPFGGAGEMQEEVVNVTRARSTVSFTFIEKYGNPIQNFLQTWITYGMMDPDTKFANIGTVSDYPSDMLADMYAMTMLFIEPDPTHRKVVRSWITTNMFPKGTGDIIGSRDLTSASELSELTVEFAGISLYNLGANVFAQKILDKMNIKDANPYLREARVGGLTGIDPIIDNATAAGYETYMETMGKTTPETLSKAKEAYDKNNSSSGKFTNADRPTLVNT